LIYWDEKILSGALFLNSMCSDVPIVVQNFDMVDFRKVEYRFF